MPMVNPALVASMMPPMAIPVAPMTWAWKAMLSWLTSVSQETAVSAAHSKDLTEL